MAIFHCSVKTISRSAGRSACAATAYCAGEKITDERTGFTHDFTRKGGVRYSEIIVPVGSPSWATNRAELWNRAEQAEDKSTRRATATTAREFIIALPHELNSDAQLNLAREFAQYLVITYGVAVDLCIHEPSNDGDKRNDHAHLLTTDRRITDAGFAGKVRELNIANGGRKNIALIREQWAKITNRYLERAGVHERIDHRSYKSQGVSRVATTHLGVAATALERRGEASEHGNRNRVARAINALREKSEEVGETKHALELTETNGPPVTRLVSETVLQHETEGLEAARKLSAALSEQHTLGHQKATEARNSSTIRMTHEERIKEAVTKARASKECSLVMGVDYRGQNRGR